MASTLLQLLMILQLVIGLDTHPYLIPAASRVTDDVSTILSDIRIEGVVDGDVTSWGGNIVVVGQVTGDVVSYTGNVTIMPGAAIGGSLLSLGGRVTAAPGTFSGQRIEGGSGGRVVGQVVGLFTGESRLGNAPDIGRILFSLTLCGALLAFSLLALHVWPQRTEAGAFLLKRLPIRSIVLGILVLVALATLTPMASVLLTSTIIGMPVALVLLMLVHAFVVAGMVTLIQAARASLASPRTNQQEFSARTVLISFILLLPIGLVGLLSPLAALLLCYAIASPGMGALLLTRTPRMI